MMSMDTEPRLNTQETKPHMTVFAGTNGAGKSTITDVLAHQVGEVIDTDAIAKRMNPDNPEAAAVKAGRETLKRVQVCIDQRRDFSIETTLAGGNVLRQMERAKEAGFGITMYYVGLKNVDYHIERVARRVEAGGHSIPEADIRRRYDRSLDKVPQAIRLADRVFVFDNSTGFKKTLDVNQGLIQIHTSVIPKWLDRIIKGWDKEQEKMNRDLERKKDQFEKNYDSVHSKLLQEKEKLKPIHELERLKNLRDQLVARLIELKPKNLLEKITNPNKQTILGVQQDVQQLDAKILQVEKKVPSPAEVQLIQKNMTGLGSLLTALQSALQQIGQDLLTGQQQRQLNQLHRQYGTSQQYIRDQGSEIER
ncbi:putative ABC-type ATPase [Paenibacillus prosopidis]|uniref:UDP-N-acetylglucosamine kinase n=2 Tax=Paenibacillus prosopidis TaxID=630520 RepID=A0A368VLP5_9BACL|nr:putative ABC-type ATPase [Paenibacillus prosopidis]